MALRSIPDIVDVEVIGPAKPFDLVIEIPHGATRTADFTGYAARLASPMPDQLVDFFHVNTDQGAPELAQATAKAFVAAEPARSVAIIRCRIPRTFIDCNRRIDASAADFKAGGVTPGLMPWITDPDDDALLRRAYDQYVATVRAATAELAPDGAMLLLHTYAPRTVDVEVDLKIVDSLHAAYADEARWPLRAELDVIGRAIDGTDHAPAVVVDALRRELPGVTVADSATYPIHPSTLAWEHVMAHPGRALCLEVRRDLLAGHYEPFAEMPITKLDWLAAPLATALRRWW